MPDMLDAFFKSVDPLGLSVIEKIELPPRSEQLEQVPAAYLAGRVGRWLNAGQFGRGLWTHQAEALRAFDAGANVVISTGTASGKSLVFQAAALKLLDEHPEAVILVLYPLKALVADQLVSWRKILTQAGYPADAIGKIDGDVLPDEREKLVQNAQIIVATPDVTHAWLMSNLARPHHKRFLSRLARLVAPDGHRPNLLTEAISASVRWLREREPTCEAIISYADSAAGHHGGVYRAASWVPLAASPGKQSFRCMHTGRAVGRRSFHSNGKAQLRECEIIALGYEKTNGVKHRYARGLTHSARRAIAEKARELAAEAGA